MFLLGNRQVMRVREEHDLTNANFCSGTVRVIMFCICQNSRPGWTERRDVECQNCFLLLRGRNPAYCIVQRRVNLSYTSAQPGEAGTATVKHAPHCMRNGRRVGFTAKADRTSCSERA